MKYHGFSLIELIVFILVIGIVSSGILGAFQTTLQNAPTGNYQTIALGLAQERMELILAQRRLKGFTLFSDPCASGGPSICTLPTGYSINSNTISSPYTINSDSNYKKITVTISGLGDATLTAIVGS
jgi:type II secretory pathway pseudopilin PulG